MNEFIQVLKGLWTEDHFTFHGEFYQADDATIPMKPVRLPIRRFTPQAEPILART